MTDAGAIDTRRHAGVLTVTINRPPLNLLSPPLLHDLRSVLHGAENDDGTRVIVLRGEGTRAFSAGADIRAGGEDGSLRAVGRDIVDSLERSPKPSIASIGGWAIGGGAALALACDIRVAAESARFRTGDAYLGVMPSWGLSASRLVHYIGRMRTLDMLLLGHDLSAEAAERYGLLTEVVPDEALSGRTEELAARLATASPLAVRAIKEAVVGQYRGNVEVSKQLEQTWADALSLSDDGVEGRRAFLEKRPPVFSGTWGRAPATAAANGSEG